MRNSDLRRNVPAGRRVRGRMDRAFATSLSLKMIGFPRPRRSSCGASARGSATPRIWSGPALIVACRSAPVADAASVRRDAGSLAHMAVAPASPEFADAGSVRHGKTTTCRQFAGFQQACGIRQPCRKRCQASFKTTARLLMMGCMSVLRLSSAERGEWGRHTTFGALRPASLSTALLQKHAACQCNSSRNELNPGRSQSAATRELAEGPGLATRVRESEASTRWRRRRDHRVSARRARLERAAIPGASAQWWGTSVPEGRNRVAWGVSPRNWGVPLTQAPEGRQQA